MHTVAGSISQDANSANAPVAAPRASAHAEVVLSAQEVYRLTLFKWRYSLEAYGFTAEQVRQLLFLKWLQATRRVEP